MKTGADLAAIRERKPLVHQITNYVVMNETANATLSLGALPVMAHAIEEVEEMASVAGALVLNIGTLSTPWIDAMLLAGKAANRAGAPVVLDPVGVGATRLRTDTAQRILEEVEIAVVRGNQAEVATLAGRQAEIRGVESIGAADSAAELAKVAAAELGRVVAVTGPVDHVSDGNRSIAVANGHELLGTVSGTGCMSTAITGCFLAVAADRPLEAAAEALVAFGVAGGATVIQLRLKGASTEEVIALGAPFGELGATFVVNDDVQAAIALGADGVHLGRDDPGAEEAIAAGLLLGTSASNVDEAKAGEALGAAYIGAGPVWETPTKLDADPPIGLDGLAEICAAVSIPVIAIGGIDAGNAAECIAAGAFGVAVVRAAADARAVSEALAAR